MLKKHVKIGEGEPNLKKAYDLMLAWDGDNRIDSPEASIYNTFYVRFAYNTFADELGGGLATEYIAERYISMERFLDMVENGSEFFDDVSTPSAETVSDIAAKAFRESCEMSGEDFWKFRSRELEMGEDSRHTFRSRAREIRALPSPGELRPLSLRGGRRDEQPGTVQRGRPALHGGPRLGAQDYRPFRSST